MLPGLARSRRGVFTLQPRSPMSRLHGQKRADATTLLTADCDPAGGSGDAGNLEPGNSSNARAGATTKQLLRPGRQDKQTYACPGVDFTLKKQKKMHRVTQMQTTHHSQQKWLLEIPTSFP